MHLGRLTAGFVGGVVTMSNWGEVYLEIVRIPGATNLLGNSNLTLQELRDEPRSMSQGLESPTRISLVAGAYDLQSFDHSGRQTVWENNPPATEVRGRSARWKEISALAETWTDRVWKAIHDVNTRLALVPASWSHL
jgi:hypothetical protein